MAAWLAGCAAVWLVLSAADVTAAALTPGSVPRNAAFTARERAGLLGWNLLVIAGWVLVGGAVVAGVRAAAGRATIADRPWAAWAGRGVAVVVTTVLVFAWLSSWGAFRALNAFLDAETLAFAYEQRLQVLHWAPLGLVVVAAVASPVLAGLLLWYVPRVRRALPPRGQTALLLLGAGGAVAAGVAALAGAPGGDRASEMLVLDTRAGATAASPLGSFTVGQLYREARRARAGPFARAATDVAEWLAPREDDLRVPADVPVRYPPILPTGEYLARVDRASFRPLNVLVVVVESLGTTPLKSYGGPREVMPNVDALAAQSRVWRRAYAQATHSNYATFCPVSGQYPLRSRQMYSYPPNPSYPRVMLYDLLKPLGYRTATFSSGNELWSGMTHFWQTGNLDKSLHAANFGGPTYVAAADTGFARWVAQTRSAGTIDDRFTVDELIKWVGDGRTGESVDAAGKRRPWFAYFNPQNAHFPYVVPAEFPRKFSDGRVDFFFNFNSYPPEKAAAVRDLYDDSLRYVDAQLGRLFEHLRRTGQWDDTLVVLTSDHGQAFYEHGFAAHANAVFEECLRVPLIVRSPGLSAGVEADENVQHVDVMPTVLRLLGLPPHPAPQGVDLLDAGRPRERSVFAMAHSPLAHQYAIIRGRQKLIYDARLDAYALYDLAVDPGERTDRLPTSQDLAKRLADRLHAWRAAQIGYYADPVKQRLTYPPVLAER